MFAQHAHAFGISVALDIISNTGRQAVLYGIATSFGTSSMSKHSMQPSQCHVMLFCDKHPVSFNQPTKVITCANHRDMSYFDDTVFA